MSRTAPVKAPRAWPKSSEIRNWSDRVGALTVTSGFSTGTGAGGASGQARSCRCRSLREEEPRHPRPPPGEGATARPASRRSASPAGHRRPRPPGGGKIQPVACSQTQVHERDVRLSRRERSQRRLGRASSRRPLWATRAAVIICISSRSAPPSGRSVMVGTVSRSTSRAFSGSAVSVPATSRK